MREPDQYAPDVPPACEPAPALTSDQHVARIESYARLLAGALTEANEAGVSPALVLPRLMLVFRGAFGALPAGFTLPGGLVMPEPPA